MKEANVRHLAIKLELMVKDTPYIFVPDSGPFAGAMGLNYTNIVRAVLELAKEIKE